MNVSITFRLFVSTLLIDAYFSTFFSFQLFGEHAGQNPSPYPPRGSPEPSLLLGPDL